MHRLGLTDLNRLERELIEFSKESHIALVLPCHINEVGTDALRLILSELHNVTYLKEIIVGIDGATLEQWQTARKTFSQLPACWSVTGRTVFISMIVAGTAAFQIWLR